jgi:hypothetical protein
MASGPRSSAAFSACPAFQFVAEQDVLAADVVLDREPFGRPFGYGLLLADQADHFAQPGLRHARDGAVIHQHRRSLVAHAGAGRGVHADQAVFRDTPRFQPELLAHGIHQIGIAEHAVGDVVRPEHAVFAALARVEEAVEGGGAADLGTRPADAIGDVRQCCRRKPVQGSWISRRICIRRVPSWPLTGEDLVDDVMVGHDEFLSWLPGSKMRLLHCSIATCLVAPGCFGSTPDQVPNRLTQGNI